MALTLEEIQLLELRFYEDKSYKEIAFITDLTVTNLKNKVWRILEKIRKKMNNYETPE